MSFSLGLTPSSSSTPGGNTPYEGHGGTFSIHLGRIVEVNAESRLCKVSGMIGSDWGPVWMQYLSTDTNPDGDESGSIPRKGSMGLVFVVGGEPFLWGCFRPMGKGGSCKQGPENLTIGEGDKFISTKAGNRLTLKRSGLVELYCKDTLQRLMFPVGSRIADICREYNLKADGGVIEWPIAEPFTGNTLWNAEFAMQIARAFVVHEQKGYVDSDIILKTVVGPAFPGVKGSNTPTYTHTVNISGEMTTTVSPPQLEGTPTGFKSVIGPDGSINILAGLLQKVVMSISSTGDVSLDVNELAHMGISSTGDIIANNKVGEASISAAGDLTLKNKLASATMSSTGDIEIKGPMVTVSITAAGEVTFTGLTKMSVDAKAGVSIKSTAGPIEVDAGAGKVILKSMTGIELDGTGAGVLEGVLTSPTTLSPFTGAPLLPGSKTVMASPL